MTNFMRMKETSSK